MSDLPSRGKRFDFRRVLEHAPDAQEALHATEAAITAGDLIRRVRMRKGMSSDDARRARWHDPVSSQ